MHAASMAHLNRPFSSERELRSSEFVRHFRPRVERASPMSLYHRAQPDLRPCSISFAKADNNIGSVSFSSLSRSLTQSSLGVSQFSSTTMRYKKLLTDFEKPPGADRIIPIGEKRQFFKVHRVCDDHYTFSRGGPRAATANEVLDPGPGVIRDRDSVERVMAKLSAAFPDALPSIVPMGDAGGGIAQTLAGSSPSRPVRTVLMAKTTMLDAAHPIGLQCQRTTYSKYYRQNKGCFNDPFKPA